ncbi:MAG: thioether cross-link-forming SCIFF peptide maturase [Firmicutes bacterium]|nr:thioether cross-link-forming SCIFF peptide maturase [Bacillota bacterium]
MVHTYCLNGLYIALDVNSGSIHLVEEVVHRILKEFPHHLPIEAELYQRLGSDYSQETIHQAYLEIKPLLAENLLYSPEITWEQVADLVNKPKGLKALCLHVAHDCNLRCEYCFAAKGDYHGGRTLMSSEVTVKAIDFLVQNSDRHELEIDFFGGEPLLNFETVKTAVSYGRKLEQSSGKKLHFTITTNGTLLNDSIIDYINENIDNVVISIDGRQEVHDGIRYYPGGKGSYERILPMAQKLISKRGSKEYYIRGTYTANNLDFANDVLHLADLGFREISVEPAVGKIEGATITREHLPQILPEYENLAQKYLERIAAGKPFRFYHFNLNLYGGPCIYKRITACGAGTEYLAVSPQGELYPCHQFVGEAEFVMGNLETGITNHNLLEQFKGSNIFSKEACRSCWAKYFCSGGCHANSYYNNDHIEQPDELTCAMQRKRIECAIMVEVMQRMEKE